MVALIKYNYKIYIKYNKFMIPLICFCMFQIIYYSTGQEKFASSIILCANLVFIIMAWMGFSYCELQDWRTEQIAFLKINNNRIYWLSKIFFMWSIGISISLVGTIWPLVCNLVADNSKISFSDIIFGFTIQILVAFMGALLGMIVQTKIIGTRNRALLILILSGTIATIKIPLIKEYSFAKIITWVLPPINDLTSSCMGFENFSLSLLGLPIIYSIVYIAIAVFIYIRLMSKLLF